jgi:CheY-like chemotaxis protein
MTPEVISRAFDPFFTTKFTGRGLGLSAVLGILRRHRAALNVESAEGVGTTMTVLLPSSGRANARPQKIQGGSSLGVPPGLRVLLVDDELSVRDVTLGLLEEIGCVVEVAESSDAALEICARRASDLALVLMDVTMPGLDGVATRELLTSRHPGLPVLLMSGFGPPAAIASDAFLGKPFTLDDLRVAVAALVSPQR